MSFWSSALIASTQLSGGSLGWKPALLPSAALLQASLENVPPDAFAAAVQREIADRAALFLAGLERYRHHPYRRATSEPPAVWQRGPVRLIDYGPPDGAPVLAVPSLINRAYILDLTPEKSLLRHLSRAGLRPFLLDWGAPGEAERTLDLTAYIDGFLTEAAAETARIAARPPMVLGYCMGGLLAVALAQRRPDLVSALALLATPWDFHAERASHARLLGRLARPLVESFAAMGEIPVDVLQMFFLANDPLTALRKFSLLATLPEGGDAELSFVALEDWLNDGVPLPIRIAEECLATWYGDNLPGLGRWRIGGRPVLPEEVEAPSLVLVPRQDRIVPPLTAAALADHLIAVERRDLPLGHIGMVVGGGAPKIAWAPLTAWLLDHI